MPNHDRFECQTMIDSDAILQPADMLRQIITASSHPGDLVADFFMGSGSTIKAALSLGRHAIGVELEEERFNQTVSEIKENS